MILVWAAASRNNATLWQGRVNLWWSATCLYHIYARSYRISGGFEVNQYKLDGDRDYFLNRIISEGLCGGEI